MTIELTPKDTNGKAGSGDAVPKLRQDEENIAEGLTQEEKELLSIMIAYFSSVVTRDDALTLYTLEKKLKKHYGL